MSRPFTHLTTLIALAAMVLAMGCGRKQAVSPEAGASSIISAVANQAAADPAKGANALLQAATEPTRAFHFSYRAQSQINPKFPNDPEAKPEVGPVTLEAEISPEEITLDSVRGTKKTKTVAQKVKELDWAMIKLGLLGPLSDVSMTLAFASSAMRLVGPGVEGGMPVDLFAFDTRTASPAQKAGMAAAMGLLGGRLKHEAIYGTAAVEKATGLLVKFSMDSELKDTKGNVWKEHHEGEVTPKK